MQNPLVSGVYQCVSVSVKLQVLSFREEIDSGVDIIYSKKVA